MARNSEGQLTFDLSPGCPTSNSEDDAPPCRVVLTNSVLSLSAHRNRKEDAERARYFSEILKLVAHLKR
jgi:hypothetical protein